MAVSKEHRELLLRKITKANLPPEPTCGPNDTISFLVSLTAAWPGPITGEQKSGLEALCRQLAVKRKVLQSYDVEWKRATDSRPLGAQQWTILIVALLAEYEDGEGASEYTRGMELKRLNAAYIAIATAGSLEDVPYLEELESWADERLCELTGT